MYKFIFSFLLVFSIMGIFAFDHVDTAAPESTGIGSRSFALQDVADTVTASTTFVNTDLTFTLAANQKVHVTYFVPITLGGTAPGIKFQVDAPAAPAAYLSAVDILADDASVALVNVVTTEGAQGVTLANAGNHIAKVEATITNGSTAGPVTLQFAQNVSDAAVTVVMKGAYAEIVKM